jgi:PAS domain S-box-containing protein
MNFFVKFLLLVLFFCSLNANSINLTKEEKEWINNNTIKVGVSPWYPITYIDKKTNKASGVGIDILKLVIKNTGLKVQYIPKQWSVLLNDFKAHKIDLLPTTYYTKQRAKFGDYTSSYMSIKEYLYVKENSQIKNFDDLKNRSIAMVKKYGTIDKIKQKYPSIKIIEVDTLEKTVKMLINGEVDAIFNTQFSIDNFIKANFITGLKALYQTDFEPSKLYYFTNKNKPILNKILQKAVLNLDDNEKNEIINNWIVNTNIKKEEDKNYLTKIEKNYLKKHKIVRMCNNPNWEPIEFAKNENMNQMSGIAIDTLKVLEKKLNIKFVNVPTSSWIQSQQFLKEKKCDILPCAIETKKRKNYANFTKPYLSYKLAIITKNNKPFVNDIEDIIDKTIARKKGSGLITKLKQRYPDVKIIETKDYLQSLQKVSNGEAYCTIATLPIASYYINKFSLNNLQISGFTNMKYDLSIAVRDDYDILLSILDKSLDQIPQSIHKEIYRKWLGNNIQESQIDYKLISYILITIFIIILFLLYKQSLLKNSIKDFNELIDATMEGIILFKNGKCIDANQSALDILGYKNKEELIGKNPLSFASKKSEDIVKENMKKDDAKPYEAIMLKKDGSEFNALLRGYNLKNKQVRLSSLIDITNLKKQEKLISEQSKLVAMGEMIGNIAHQWRQPLSVISTSATGMQMKQEMNILDENSIQKSCSIINQNAQYLSKTIDDFKNFVKGNERKVEFNLYENFQSLLHLLEGTIKKYNIQIIENIDKDLFIKNLDNQLIQCYINIINNSRDAFNENNIEQRYIFINISKNNNNVIIDIQDTAGGIPKQYLNKIFEPYFTTKHESQGTGIGLNMTFKLITEGMKGNIYVCNSDYTYKNKHYYGAKFTIVLPYINEDSK